MSRGMRLTELAIKKCQENELLELLASSSSGCPENDSTTDTNKYQITDFVPLEKDDRRNHYDPVFISLTDNGSPNENILAYDDFKENDFPENIIQHSTENEKGTSERINEESVKYDEILQGTNTVVSNLDKKKVLLYDTEIASWIDVETVNLSTSDSPSLDVIFSCDTNNMPENILDEDSSGSRKEEPINLKHPEYENIGDPNIPIENDPDYNPNDQEECDSSEPSSDYEPEVSPNSMSPDPIKNTTRKSRGRKRKFEQQTTVIAKKLKNSNKEYYNYKGILVKPKIFHDFQCLCKEKCHDKVSPDIRQQEFNKFWGLGEYTTQNLYLATCVKEKEKLRQYTNRPSKRQFSRIYSLRNVSVCREFFRKTFQVSTKRINTALQKTRSEELKDKRGQKQGGVNKTSEKKIDAVKEHINKLPRYKSHYRRETTDSDFLAPDMTLVKMYDLYVEDFIGEKNIDMIKEWRQENETKKSTILKAIDAVSFSTYRRIFLNNFNLKLKSLKKDTCNTCDSFAARIQSTKNDSDRQVLEQEHNKHINLWREARELMNEDKQEAEQNKEFECISYDLENTLPLPRIPTSIVFYKRQLWLYNAGVHSFKKKQGYCYVWTENQAGRGSQEIGSCLIKFIETEVKNGIKNLVLWSDSCGGQNRNIKMVLILKSCLEAHPTLKTISMKYLVSGPSFLANDTDFSDIEGALKHVQRLYLPCDYIQVMRSARKKKPLVVTEMQSSDFFGTQKLEKIIVNRKVDEAKGKINWLKIREIKLVEEEPLKLYCRNDFKSEYSVIDIERRASKGKQKTTICFKDSLASMWENGKEIASPKLKDLKSLLHLIPADAKEFYRSLTGSHEVEDDVDGFCIPPDFEVDIEET